MTTRRTRIAGAATAAALGIAGLGVFAAPAGAATPTSTTPTGASVAAPSSTNASCDKAPWEPKVEGYPKGFGAGSPSGVYLWHDPHGFRLRVTHAKHDERVYSGEITSNHDLAIDPVKLEKGDTLKLSANKHTLVYAFANYGGIDGVNFHTYCGSTLTVNNLHVGNDNLTTKQVYLGYYKQHPAHIPFTVHRYRKP